jgi:hypothetical protein
MAQCDFYKEWLNRDGEKPVFREEEFKTCMKLDFI